MRRVLRWPLWTLAVIIAVPVLTVAVVAIALNTDPGRHLAERLTAQLTGGEVTLSGIAGRFPDKLRISEIQIRDAKGAWLTVRDAALDWSPSRLLARDAAISRLTAAEVDVARLPESSTPSQPSSGGSSFQLPVRVDADSIQVARISVAPAVAGVPALLALDGSAHLASLQVGAAEATIRQLDGGGVYHAKGHIDDAGLSATLQANEPAHGLASLVADLPDLGALSVQASVDGPWSAAVTDLTAAAGPLRATAKGRIDITGSAADLDVTASAPAMTPRPDLSWQSVALDAHVHGPFTRPQARANVEIDGLAAAGAALRRLTAKVDGDRGQVALDASAEGVRIPGPKPDLLAAAPLLLHASASLDTPTRPLIFSLTHPLFSVQGGAETGGDLSGHAYLQVADIAPFAAAGGVDLQGQTALTLKAVEAGGTTTLDVDGTLGITGGMAPVPGLLGPQARIGVTAAVRGENVILGRLKVDGSTLNVNAQGRLTGGNVALDWQVALSDLSVLAATVQGKLQAQGHVAGTTQDLSVQADASGDIATQGVPSGPIKLSLTAEGLPDKPTGKITAEGTLDGAKLALDAAAQRQPDGALHLSINRADWKSAHAEGAFTLPPGSDLPLGKVSLRMDRLDDLRRLIGQPVAGAVDATAEITDTNGRKLARLQLTARNAGLPGTAAVDRVTLAASVLDPVADPDVNATLDVAGLHASGIGGTAQVTAKGRQSALALRLQAGLTGVDGADMQATGAAQLDVPAKNVSVSALQATWKGETLRLLGPTRVAFANGIALDRLRLGLRDAVLEVAGRVSPTLDMTASLTHVSADLARIVAPDIQAEGTLEARAKLTGTTARPSGTVHLAATGLRMRTGPAAALKPASITADATLAGTTANVRAHVAEASNAIDLTGTVPIDPAAAMDLRAKGDLDLSVLDPLVSAQGRLVRGKVTLDASVTGTMAAPRADGTVRLANGDVQDFAQGAHIANIQALIRADGDTVHIASFTARAGNGTLSAAGSVGLGGTMPVDLHLGAKNASPLASDKLTAVLDMDLSLRGDLHGQLAVTGTVKVDSADIRIPEQLPAKVVVLNVRRPGQPPPPPPSPGPDIGLNVTVNAPGQVFVRGRGLFAELQGRIHVGGTAAAPVPTGKFELRRGEFNLAGRTLTFTTGEVGFDGSGRIDPTLNFVASSTNGSITATLTISGYASAPKIALSSTPELPQDEILAQLLFHQSASSLNGFQLAEAAAALAQVSGVGGGVFDPLNSVRQGLGLDRLSVGGSQTGSGASLEAGRYVTRNVYVGAKQSTDGTTQATVQIDLLKGLKLETDVGTGGSTSATGASATDDPNGTTVGLTYHFDY